MNSLSQFSFDVDPVKKDSKNPNKFNLALDAFRKRVQSDSQHNKSKYCDKNISCKCDTISENSGSSLASYKKRFNLNVTPSKTKNILKNSKMARAFKKIGGSSNFNDLKNSAKSCETLDSQDIEVPVSKRCSKSEDNLDVLSPDIINDLSSNDFDTSLKWYGDKSDENIKDLSIICAENNFKNSYPEEILDLILKGKTKLVEQKLKQRAAEEEYMYMSPKGLVNDKSPEKREENIIDPRNAPFTENNYVVMKSI